MDEIQEAKTLHSREIQAIEEMWSGKLRAKDMEIEELRQRLQDKDAIADGKINEARLKLNRAEKSIS